MSLQKLRLSRNKTNAITAAEFTLAMMVKLGKLSMEEIREVKASFDKLDALKDGTLTTDDIVEVSDVVSEGNSEPLTPVPEQNLTVQ